MRYTIFAAGLFLILWHGVASAASQTSKSVFPDIRQIQDRGTLVVAVVNQFLPPLIDRTESGEFSGFEVELAGAIARNLGVGVKFDTSADTFDGVVDLVSTGRADIAASFLSLTPERALKVLFSRPYITQFETVLISRLAALQHGDQCPESSEALEIVRAGGRLGVVAGTSFAAQAERFFDPSIINTFPSNLDMFGAMFRGDLEVSFQSQYAAGRFLKDNPSYSIKLKYCKFAQAQDNIAIAVRPDARNLVDFINAFLIDTKTNYTLEQVLQQEGRWYFMYQ